MLLLLTLILAGPQIAHGQSTPSSVPPVHDYYLGPEDVLGITVVNFPNLSVPQGAVMPDGTISLPLLNSVSVAGKTTVELAQMLTEKWSRYVINPVVNVTLVQRRSESVYLFGLLARTGKIEYRVGEKLMEAIAECGGALPQGDLSQVTVIHKNGEKETLDLSRPEAKAGSSVDIVLQTGDLVHIPERHMEISVVGQVARPGSYDFKDEMHVLDAITLAGGVEDTADLLGATLIHNGTEQKLNLDALLKRGDVTVNTPISPGDRIMVPEIKNRTYVFGAVGKPGYYAFKPGDKILDALNSADGPIKDANMHHINRIRNDPTTGKPILTTINMDRYFKSGDASVNLPLQAGDLVYVPSSKHGLGVQEVFGALSSVSLFAGLFRLLQ
jgi:protein involved in polysaccharide export with SLBB domain